MGEQTSQYHNRSPEHSQNSRYVYPCVFILEYEKDFSPASEKKKPKQNSLYYYIGQHDQPTGEAPSLPGTQYFNQFSI